MSPLSEVLRGMYRKEENTDIQNQCEKLSLTPWEFQSVGNTIPTIFIPSLLTHSSGSAIQFWSLCDTATLMAILPLSLILLELSLIWLAVQERKEDYNS